MMPKRGNEDPRTSWPPDFNEIIQKMHKEEMRRWLRPKSGDLLGDVIHLQSRMTSEKGQTVRGVYARAVVVMSAATMEAITNDVLATIYELLTDAIPFECVREPPWCYFIGRSPRRIESLLRRGSFAKKRDYILSSIYRTTGHELEPQFIKDMDRVFLLRNRIVHMSFQERPERYNSMLNASQAIHTAALAAECAHMYLDFLSWAFTELKLPILTLRPTWHFQAASTSP